MHAARVGMLMALVISLLFPPALLAGDSLSKTAGKVLQIGVGAGPVGMGEAQAAAADDAYALYWNPAGLSRLRRTQITAMHNSWFGGINSEYAAYVQPLVRGGIGLGLNYVNFGEFKKYGIDANNYPVPMEGSFTPFTLVVTGGYSQRLLTTLSAGATVKLISESVDTYNNLSLALDLGAQWLKILPDLDAGLVVQNLGLPLQGYGLPINIKAGVAYHLPPLFDEKKDVFEAVLDVNAPIPFDQPFYGNFGMEYWFDNTVALRAGYKLSEINSLGSASGLTAGLGVRYQDYTLDYAFAPYGELGSTHRISFSLEIGPVMKVKRTRRRTGLLSNRRGPAVVAAQPMDELLVPKISGLTLRKPVNLTVQAEPDPQDRFRLKQATFTFRVNTETQVQQWTLRVLDLRGKLIREFSGQQVPETLAWDGKDKYGRRPTETISATYEFSYTLADGTAENAKGQLLQEAQAKTADEGAAASDRAKMKPIFFDENSYDLTQAGIQTVGEIAQAIKSRTYTRLVVEGYTDGSGEAAQEFVLSQRRADAVVRYLTATFQIPFTNVSVHARGSKNPLGSNQTPEGRSKNRRVEITILYPR